MGRPQGIKPSPALQRALGQLRGTRTLKELAAEVGVSSFVTWKILRGDGVEPRSLRKAEMWLRARGEGGAQELRACLARLVPDLKVRERARLEKAVVRAITESCRGAGLALPKWVKRLVKRGSKQ